MKTPGDNGHQGIAIDHHDEPLAEDEWVVPIPDLDRLERPIDD